MDTPFKLANRTDYPEKRGYAMKYGVVFGILVLAGIIQPVLAGPKPPTKFVEVIVRSVVQQKDGSEQPATVNRIEGTMPSAYGKGMKLARKIGQGIHSLRFEVFKTNLPSWGMVSASRHVVVNNQQKVIPKDIHFQIQPHDSTVNVKIVFRR